MKTTKSDIKKALSILGGFIVEFAANGLGKFSDGRTISAAFDNECSAYLKGKKTDIDKTLTEELKKQNLQLISVEIYVPEDREFCDTFITFSADNFAEVIAVNNKSCSSDKNQFNNINGGFKLVSHLLGIEIDKITFPKLVSHCEKNQNLKVDSDYYILEIDKNTLNIKFASIFDGGVVVNAAQGFPGLQYNINEAKWKDEHLTMEEKSKILKEWINLYEVKYETKRKKIATIANAIYG